METLSLEVSAETSTTSRQQGGTIVKPHFISNRAIRVPRNGVRTLLEILHTMPCLLL